MERLSTTVGMVGLLQDVSPISYDRSTGKVEYVGSFKHINPDMFDLVNQEKMDFERVSDLTCWSPELDIQSMDLTPVKAREESNSLAALFSAN